MISPATLVWRKSVSLAEWGRMGAEWGPNGSRLGDSSVNVLSYHGATTPVRGDLTDAHRRAWRRLAAPGTWWHGKKRVAIAAETRNTAGCEHCRDGKAALSPYSVEGSHRSLGQLPESVVEVVHRITTDPGRLTRAWFDRAINGGISDGEFIETVAVVVTTIAIDTFTRAIGLRPHPLPKPEGGEPSYARPTGAKPGPAWVPMLAPEDMTAVEACLEKVYVSPDPTFIRRALSLVPSEACGLFDMVDAQYLPGAIMPDLATRHRAITRAQMELIAGRVSAINGCFY